MKQVYKFNKNLDKELTEGVSYSKVSKKWLVRIKCPRPRGNNPISCYGAYATEEEANKIYNSLK